MWNTFGFSLSRFNFLWTDLPSLFNLLNDETLLDFHYQDLVSCEENYRYFSSSLATAHTCFRVTECLVGGRYILDFVLVPNERLMWVLRERSLGLSLQVRCRKGDNVNWGVLDLGRCNKDKTLLDFHYSTTTISCNPKILGLVMDPQQIIKGRLHVFFSLILFYLYILRGFKKLFMTSKNVKNTPNLIRFVGIPNLIR